jgi:hypothetical protein
LPTTLLVKHPELIRVFERPLTNVRVRRPSELEENKEMGFRNGRLVETTRAVVPKV